MTDVGLICDDPYVQARLPQVLIANGRTVLQRGLVRALADLAPNMHLMHGKSSWNNGDRMVSIIGMIGRALRSCAPGAIVILTMDAAPLHFSLKVLEECRRWGIRVVPIPAKLTFLLQPLDTHVFAQMKRCLRDASQKRVGANGGRALSALQWLDVASHSIRASLLRTSWAHSFAHNGFGASQRMVSDRVLQRMGLAAAPVLPAAPPTAIELANAFPRGSRFDASFFSLASSSSEAGGVGPRVADDMVLRMRAPPGWVARRANIIRLRTTAAWRLTRSAASGAR